MPDRSGVPSPAPASPRLRRLALLTCIGVWLTEAVFTHIPLPTLPPTVPSDKTLHVVAYFVLGSVFLLTLRAYALGLWRRLAIALPVLAVYGALDELTQPLVNRHASVYDWLADAAGVLLAIAVHAVVVMLHRHWHRRAVDG